MSQAEHKLRRQFSSSPSSHDSDPAVLLSKPSWSIKTLMPETPSSESTPTEAASDSPVSREELRHLLRLCALPPPSSPEEETSMLQNLSAQIHFINQIREVDTTKVSPLRSIRDETDEAHAENTIDVLRLRESLDRDEFVGRNRRIRRKRDGKVTHPDGDSWTEEDALLKAGGKMMGRYLVVKTSENTAD